MTSRWNLHAAWPHVGTLCLRGGALALLLHVTSLYTRDWRPVVSGASQAAEAQGATVAPEQQQTAIKPAATGASPRTADRVRRPSTETAARPQSAPSGARARRAAPRAPGRREQSRRTQVAAAPSASEPPRDGVPSSGPEAPVQFALAERGN